MNFEIKWNKHKINEIPWINKHIDHPHRKHFIQFVLNNNSIGSILEIGGGELIEARILKKENSFLRYSVVDISDSFLEFCRTQRNIECKKGSMHAIPYQEKEFDLVYLSSVIEHSPDIEKTLDELNRVSRQFYITMFKWNMKSGGLSSFYKVKRQYFSTYFNLPQLLNKIQEKGSIDDISVSLKNDKDIVSFDDYKNQVIRDSDQWRNGDRLNIIGRWNVV